MCVCIYILYIFLGKRALSEEENGEFTTSKQEITEYEIMLSLINHIPRVEASYNFTKIPIIFIDGTCCTGKTTIVAQTHRTSIKINNLIPNIGKAYNNNSLASFLYMFEQIPIYKNMEHVLIFDRSIISNYIWFSIHYLMGLMLAIKDSPLIESYLWARPFLSAYALDMNTSLLLNYLPKIHGVFLINSNYESWRKAMYARNNGSDRAYSNSRIYLYAQNHTYRFFAELTGLPVYDISTVDVSQLYKYLTFDGENTNNTLCCPHTLALQAYYSVENDVSSYSNK